MSISELSEMLPDFAKDTRLNLQSVLSREGSPGLSKEQLAGIALSCAYALQSEQLVNALCAGFQPSTEIIESAKSAASIMAMNNVYYRFLHLCEDKEFSKMPARLRMNVIGKPGIPKVDFELMSLAASVLGGCGMCINAHIAEVKKAGLSSEAVQSTARIAAVLNATTASFGIIQLGNAQIS